MSLILSLCLGLSAGQASPVQNPAVGPLKPEPGWRELGRSLWFDPKEKCVIVRARVVLREGVLEHLLCVKGTKEHEAIVATDAPPRRIHTALLLTGAEVGHPVQFQPKFEPPAGTPIAIEMRWLQDGKPRKADARDWVRDEKAKSTLAIDWVFAGSVLYEDPITKTSPAPSWTCRSRAPPTTPSARSPPIRRRSRRWGRRSSWSCAHCGSRGPRNRARERDDLPGPRSDGRTTASPSPR
jgi:hypothetical protein